MIYSSINGVGLPLDEYLYSQNKPTTDYVIDLMQRQDLAKKGYCPECKGTGSPIDFIPNSWDGYSDRTIIDIYLICQPCKGKGRVKV